MALLEYGLEKVGLSVDLCVEISRLQMRVRNFRFAEGVLYAALNFSVGSSKLWSQLIFLSNTKERRGRCLNALRLCGTSSSLVWAVTLMLSFEGRVDQTRSWQRRMVCHCPDDGDFLAWILLFESIIGNRSS